MAHCSSTSSEVIKDQSDGDEVCLSKASSCVSPKHPPTKSGASEQGERHNVTRATPERIGQRSAKPSVPQDYCQVRKSWRASLGSWPASTTSVLSTDSRNSWQSAAPTVRGSGSLWWAAASAAGSSLNDASSAASPFARTASVPSDGKGGQMHSCAFARCRSVPTTPSAGLRLPFKTHDEDPPAASAAHHRWDSHIANARPSQSNIVSPAALAHTHLEEFFGLHVHSQEQPLRMRHPCGAGPALIEAQLPYDTHADTRLHDILTLLTQGRRTVL